MTRLPEKIKQDGYNATRRGENYIVEYISGGHIPQEESINLTIEEMKVIYNNHWQVEWYNCSSKVRRR